jgi:hypothetical protein
MKALIACLTLPLLLIPAIALADMSIDLLRITCIPELRYFEIAATSSSLLAEAVAHGFSDFSQQGAKTRLKLLERHGLYSPEALKYTCTLPESTYELTTVQPPPSGRGECGSGPTATFTLRVNGTDWFREVALNAGCFDQASVMSLAILDGKKGWTGRREMIACVKEKPDAEQKCYFRGLPLPDLEKHLGNIPGFPMTNQNFLNELRRYN